MVESGGIGIGTLIMVAITVIVGAVLLVASASNTEQTVHVYTASNVTYTAPLDGETIDLDGQELIGTPIVYNATGPIDASVIINAANYTIDEGISASTGLKTVQYTSNEDEYESRSINISYQFGGDGYADDAGARAVIPLILIFMALAIAVVALDPVLRSSIISSMIGR